MLDRQHWDWDTEEKKIPLSDWKTSYNWVEEPQTSLDGEKIAAIVNIDEGEFTVCINGESWGPVYDKIWYLRFSPDGRATALVSEMGEWTVAADGVPWDNRYGYVWNTRFSSDGKQIAVAAQQDMKYGIATNDVLWETTYANMTDPVLNPDGNRSAATVQVTDLGAADIEKFKGGVFSVAVDGVSWEKVFVNVWKPVFDPAGIHLAAQVRTTLYDYTIAVNGNVWDKSFATVWEPVFHPTEGSVVAPVRTGGKWTLAKDGEIIWKGRYLQTWHQKYSADGRKLAAIVSPKYGRWTIAVDDRPWTSTLGDMVADWAFSSYGQTIAAVFKQGAHWSLAVDGQKWQHRFDMVFAPVISDDGQRVAAKVEKDGNYTLVVDDKIWNRTCQAVWDPIFSPDGQKLLTRSVENDTYYRRVIPVSEITGT